MDASGINSGTLAAIYLGLALFGIAYNALTEWAERTGYIKGYTAMFVVGGVIVTVMATAVINLTFALVVMGAFAASGTPMILGSMFRHRREELGALKKERDEARNGNPPQKMAP